MNVPNDVAVERLKQTLFVEYGGFADKRIKDLAKASTFIVDDRTERDFGSGGIYGYFCMIHAEVLSAREVRVRLSGNVPIADSVVRWAEERGVNVDKQSTTLDVAPESIECLTSLAVAIDSIVEPGRRYEVANYKYVCPRTAGSLNRLAGVLRKIWTHEVRKP